MNELYKYNTIKKLVETNGNKKAAAVKLGISIRQVNRLIITYNEQGKSGFIHGNRGRPPSTKFDDDTRSFVINLYRENYNDSNFTHFCEILKKDYNISISDNTLNKWLRNEHILSPKARNNTVKNEKKIIKLELSSAKSKTKQNDLKLKLDELDVSSAHPRRPRCKYMGEMVQMDASSFKWVDGQPIWHLHVAIDDASGFLLGAYFDHQETLNGYYHVFHQILTDYGIPAMFYTDKRTVFEYKSKKSALEDEDTFTQFSYACSQLGVEIKTTSVAQAKGRVERVNQTLQSRLPVELRRARITNIDEANEFLKSYLKEFNSQFGLQLNITKSVFESQPTEAKINKTLAIIEMRKIDSGHTFKYHNDYYYITTAVGVKKYFIKGTECMIIKCFDGNYYVNVDDHLYFMEKVPLHELESKEFDKQQQKEKPKQKYVPPVDHPWRIDSWKLYSSTTKEHLYGM